MQLMSYDMTNTKRHLTATDNENNQRPFLIRSDTESVETGKVSKTEGSVTPAAPAATAVPKSKLKKPHLNFTAIFKKPKNAKPEAEQTVQGDAPVIAGGETHPRDSEETVVITDELPEKKVSRRVGGEKGERCDG